ncbi:MAG: hypothetical protein JKY95_17575 [Planctomycetaceae bacterium]|nr:hypothetical protein [Planctomycetaceae bacterium]
MTDMQKAKFDKTFGKDMIQTSVLHLNVSQEVIITTEDKVRLCMTEHANQLIARQNWIAPLSLFVTILVVLLTADFSDRLIFPKATWHAVFVLGAILAFVWAVQTIYRAINATTSIDNIVIELKKSSTK